MQQQRVSGLSLEQDVSGPDNALIGRGTGPVPACYSQSSRRAILRSTILQLCVLARDYRSQFSCYLTVLQILQKTQGRRFFGPERAAVGGCARLRLGVAHGTAASNRGCGTAISEGCPGIPGGIPGRPRLSGGDNRRDAAAGTQVRCIPTALVDISMAGRIVHSSGIAVRPYRRLSHLSDATFTLGDLETAVEWVPHPGRWLDFFDHKTGGIAGVLSRR